MFVHVCRTCEKHTEHMDQLDSEMEQQMQRFESRIRKEVCFKLAAETAAGLLQL